MPEDRREQVQTVLKPGLSKEPLEHAGQVARIAGVLHEAFGDAGLRSTVVGGSAIELHAPGIYVSGDIDLVIERMQRQNADMGAVFEALGFEREGRHWKIGDLFVEVPSNTLTDPSEFMRVGGAVFEIVKKEVVLADRIVGFRQWYVEAWGQQAIDLHAAFGGDFDEEWLRAKLESEAALDALEPLRRLAESDEPVTHEVLEGLLRDLSRRSGR